MAIIIISFVAFLIMLLFPIMFSLFFLRQSSGKVLKIDQSKTKDPRYFVKSFTGLFNIKWNDYDSSGKIILSREENILEADGRTEYPAVCQSIVFAQNLEFRPPRGIRFEKEVYTLQNAYLNGIEVVRAICSKKDLVLGNGTRVLRWADAEGTLTVHDNCDLGISASSTTKILMGNNCRFRRLYAPAIFMGQAPEEKLPGEEPLDNDHLQSVNFETASLKTLRNIRYVNDDLTGDAGVLTGDIITKHNITVLNRMTVKGHIRSHNSIRLCDHAVVYGNLFADGDIYLGQNTCVYGSVFTQGDLYAERGASIGQPGKTKSVIARGKVIFSEECRIYGYVSSETEGRCCPDSQSKVDIEIVSSLPPSSVQKSYLMEKYRPAVISAVLLFAITASITGTAIFEKIQENERLLQEKKAIAKQLSYGVDGKPGGGPLETEPALITKDHIFFKDRVLERFNYDADAVLQSSEVLSGIMDALPEAVNKYLMIVPIRLNLETGQYQPDSGNVKKAISEIYKKMPSDVITLDTVGALLKHKDEYLFFRTDNVWTALGAYYAAEQFCENAGIDIIPLKEYREYRSNYRGTLRLLPGAESLKNYPDYVSYYFLKGAANEQTITSRRAKDDYRTYRSPAVALSRQGYDIFIGAYFSHSILRGEARNGKTLMIIGDKHGKAFAPWLTPYYENVILVEPKYFNGGYKEFWQLFSTYHITDFLLMESAQSLGKSSTTAKIREIYSKP